MFTAATLLLFVVGCYVIVMYDLAPMVEKPRPARRRSTTASSLPAIPWRAQWDASCKCDAAADADALRTSYRLGLWFCTRLQSQTFSLTSQVRAQKHTSLPVDSAGAVLRDADAEGCCHARRTCRHSPDIRPVSLRSPTMTCHFLAQPLVKPICLRARFPK